MPDTDETVPPEYQAVLSAHLEGLCRQAGLDLTPWQMSVMESVIQAHQSGVTFSMSRPRRAGMPTVRAALGRLFAEGESWIPETTWDAAVAEPVDIVDEIDRVVADQLQQTPSGYDHNLNQDYCPHSWRSEQWHGLAITTRMREMRDMHHSTIAYYEDAERVSPEVAAALEAYRYNEDESEVICPGSGFTGEFTPPSRASAVYTHADTAQSPPTARSATSLADDPAVRDVLAAWVSGLLEARVAAPRNRVLLGFDGGRQGGMVGMTIVDETMRFHIGSSSTPTEGD